MVRAAAAFVVAGLVGPALGGTAAAQIRCPTELTINEQPVAPPGMRGAPAQRTRALQRISVFDGLPSEKKEIKPSRGAGDAAIGRGAWTGAGSGGAYGAEVGRGGAGRHRARLMVMPDPLARRGGLACPIGLAGSAAHSLHEPG